MTTANRISANMHIDSFVIALLLLEIILIILYGCLASYSQESSSDKYAKLSNVSVMLLVGFGFLMTFPRKYSLGAVSINFLLTCIAMQTYPICAYIFNCLFSGTHSLILDIDTFILAEFSAASVLITFGAVLGKVSPFQMVIVTIFEVIMYSLNEKIGTLIAAVDSGGSILIHLFGACFGLGVGLSLKSRHSDDICSVYHSDLFAMIGTLFLWIYWPSFNSALITDAVIAQKVVLNTLISLCASCIATFFTSFLSRGNRRFSMVDLQNASLAGGVAIGSISDICDWPILAFIVGSTSGIISCVGFRFLQPSLESALGYFDSCGTMNLHGVPGLLGGLWSLVCISIMNHDGNKKGLAEQLGVQVALIVISVVIATTSGVGIGFLLRRFGPDQVLSDDVYFLVPDFETPFYFDKRGEISTQQVNTQTSIQKPCNSAVITGKSYEYLGNLGKEFEKFYD